jgi:predicted 2-oxoglutarate/Fe(II)-dependent dioxygenase YbiX
MDNVFQIENFLTNEECDRVIKLGIDIGLKDATTVYRTDNFNNKSLDTSFNKRKISYIVDSNLELTIDITNKILSALNDIKYFNNVTYNDILSYSFNKYTEGDFLNWHHDEHEITQGATTTLVIELSDDFEGGEFCCMINDVEKKLKKGKGTMYIFPSTTKHRVTKITKGVRYSFNAWPRAVKNKTLI